MAPCPLWTVTDRDWESNADLMSAARDCLLKLLLQHLTNSGRRLMSEHEKCVASWQIVEISNQMAEAVDG